MSNQRSALPPVLSMDSQTFFEQQRLRILEKVRLRKEQIIASNIVNLQADKFISQNDSVETELKKKTVGLVQLDEFLKIKEKLNSGVEEEEPKAKGSGKKKAATESTPEPQPLVTTADGQVIEEVYQALMALGLNLSLSDLLKDV